MLSIAERVALVCLLLLPCVACAAAWFGRDKDYGSEPDDDCELAEIEAASKGGGL